VSIRDQERRQRAVERRISEAMLRADREVRRPMEARAKAADRRKEEIKRRIEKGDVQPRPLPGMREDSMASMQSMASMEPMESMKSMQSADYASGLSAEEASSGGNMMEDMPLEGKMPIDPAAAEEDIAQRITEDTGTGGDPHEHNEIKADQMAQSMTEDTGAGGDMNLHAERKVDQMGNEMFED
jgi:hypothetical protein